VTQPFLRAGRTASHPPAHAPNAALLIDFDNVTLGIRSDLAKELRTLLNSDIIKGKVAVQRAYADWRRYPQYIVPLSESSIDLIFAPAFGSTKKNATDIRLAVDAIELVFTRPEIGTYILLSGDSDFSSMVLKLKEYGKYVIGVGIRESASDLLIQNCDEYYSYNDLAGLSRAADAPTAKRDPWELVREAVAQMVRNEDVMRSDRLKQVMQQLDSNFDERDLGYSRFSKFVVDAGQKGLLQVSKLDNGQYEVAPAAAAAAPAATASGTAAAPADEAGRRSRRGRGRGGRDRERGERTERTDRPERTERGGERDRARESGPVPTTDAARSLTLARAFELLNQALSELGGGPVADETVRARMAALHGREDALLEPSRFQRLLRQANDAEVADVRKTDDDTFEVTAPRIDVRMSRTRADAGRGRKPVEPEAVKAVEAEAEQDGDLATPAAAEAAPLPAAEIPAAPMAPAASAGATRMGLRFRRGSRSPMRGGEVPLVGVVASQRTEPVPSAPAAAAGDVNGAKPRAESPAPQVADAKPAAGAKAAAGAKPARPAKRGGRAPAAKAAKAAAPAGGASAGGAAPPAKSAKAAGAAGGRKPASRPPKTAKSPPSEPAVAAPPAGGEAKPAQPRRARPRARKAAKE
jgi:uncharacterized protein (TIGR00288 family)